MPRCRAPHGPTRASATARAACIQRPEARERAAGQGLNPGINALTSGPCASLLCLLGRAGSESALGAAGLGARGCPRLPHLCASEGDCRKAQAPAPFRRATRPASQACSGGHSAARRRALLMSRTCKDRMFHRREAAGPGRAVKP